MTLSTDRDFSRTITEFVVAVHWKNSKIEVTQRKKQVKPFADLIIIG